MSRSLRRRRRRPARARVEDESFCDAYDSYLHRGTSFRSFAVAAETPLPRGYASFITGSTKGFICAMYMMPHIIQQQNTELANSRCGNLRGNATAVRFGLP